MFKKKVKEVIVTEDKLPEGTDEVVRIRDIIIPPEYHKHKVSWYKIKKAIDYYNENGAFDKPISIMVEITRNDSLNGNKPNKLHLVDEYSRYIAAKYYLGLKTIPVTYISID
jgi:hypothetical protein